MLSLSDIQMSFQVAVFACCFVLVLIQPDMIFERYGQFVFDSRFSRRYPELVKVLGACERCFAGQIALWSFLIVNASDFDTFTVWPRLICFVALSILSTEFVSLLLHRLRR